MEYILWKNKGYSEHNNSSNNPLHPGGVLPHIIVC